MLLETSGFTVCIVNDWANHPPDVLSAVGKFVLVLSYGVLFLVLIVLCVFVRH